MKILLTGYRGFIAQHMRRKLEETGHTVSLFEWGEEWPGVQGQDWVIHMGAISATTERDVDKVMRQNYDFSRDLYDECRHYGVNLQYSSSASVYGLGTDFRESAPVDPRTPYAWSKYLTERYIQQNPDASIRVQGFRYFNVYGPEGEEHKGTQASPYMQFKRQAETEGKIRIFENSDVYLRDFIPVQQVIDAHMDFLYNDNSGLWNLGTGTTKSFREVAESFGVPIEIIPMPPILRDSYQKYTCADMTEISRVWWQRSRILVDDEVW